MSREITDKAVATREVDEGATLLAVIARAASDPNVDINKMRALLDMRRDLERDEAERQFSDAMNEVQKLIEPIAADANNPQTKSQYASYYALDKVLRPIYTAHGFEVSFDTEDSPLPEHVRVVCSIAKGGHVRHHRADMPADGKGAKGGDVMTKTHAVGSAIQYGKRYTLGMGFNISVAKDDDGNAAGGGFVSDKQRDELIELADANGVDKEAFCKWADVPSLADILARDFAKAKTAMLAKGKKQKAMA